MKYAAFTPALILALSLATATQSASAQVSPGAPPTQSEAEAFRAALVRVAAETPDTLAHTATLKAAALVGATLGANPHHDSSFFSGDSLAGWQGAMQYWSVEDGAIVGSSDEEIPRNEFLWSAKPVANFYLALDVQLTPASGNAGIQFRSKPIDEHGQALGYQADVGEGWWGKLYHEHGRQLLDGNENGNAAVKPGEWNRYEILAVGPAIWTAINGKLCTALLDIEGEATGQIALQIHSGPPETVRYRIDKLVHDPELAIAGLRAEELVSKLRAPIAE